MNDLLFAVPWWIPALLAVIGIALFINGNSSQVLKVRNAGVAVFLIAIAWALVSYLVDTDKEKVEKANRSAIQAVVDRDWDRFKSHMTASTELVVGRDRPRGADLIADYAKACAEMIHLKSAHVNNLTIEQTGPLITVHCDIFSQQDAAIPAQTSSWQFTWSQSGKEWKLSEIRLTRLAGATGDEISVEGMPRPK